MSSAGRRAAEGGRAKRKRGADQDDWKEDSEDAEEEALADLEDEKNFEEEDAKGKKALQEEAERVQKAIKEIEDSSGLSLKQKIFHIMFIKLFAVLEGLGNLTDNAESMGDKNGMCGILGRTSMLNMFLDSGFTPQDSYGDAGSGEGMLLIMLIVFLLIYGLVGRDTIFMGFDCNEVLVRTSNEFFKRVWEEVNKQIKAGKGKERAARPLLGFFKRPPCSLTKGNIFHLVEVRGVTVMFAFAAVWSGELKAAFIWLFMRSAATKLCVLNLPVRTPTHTHTHTHTHTA